MPPAVEDVIADVLLDGTRGRVLRTDGGIPIHVVTATRHRGAAVFAVADSPLPTMFVARCDDCTVAVCRSSGALIEHRPFHAIASGSDPCGTVLLAARAALPHDPVYSPDPGVVAALRLAGYAAHPGSATFTVTARVIAALAGSGGRLAALGPPLGERTGKQAAAWLARLRGAAARGLGRSALLALAPWPSEEALAETVIAATGAAVLPPLSPRRGDPRSLARRFVIGDPGLARRWSGVRTLWMDVAVARAVVGAWAKGATRDLVAEDVVAAVAVAEKTGGVLHAACDPAGRWEGILDRRASPLAPVARLVPVGSGTAGPVAVG